MATEKIIADWKKQTFQPIYWLEGDEDYFIDKVVDYAEKKILSDSEASFNLSVFYGKDAAWADVVNACRRYPMFAEKQVVILKEAQQMKDIEKLEVYVESPLPSTIFVVAFKEKKIDGRSKFAKLLKSKSVFITTKKLYENQLPDWTENLVKSKNLTISPKALIMLIDHIGNDLNRIDNEINKIAVNLKEQRQITEHDIEEYIGISREYNVFELQNAIIRRDMTKALKIAQYFEANPKAGPIQLILPSLYSFFSKVYMTFGVTINDEKAIAAAIGINHFFIKDYLQAARLYKASGIEKALILLHQYNLKSIGIGNVSQSDASLLKELLYKLIYD